VAILSFFVLKEELNFQKFVGIVIVVAGLFLSQIKRKKPGEPEELEAHQT
jgi:drug/metabolite transporter (DMT)-like permease